jgi:DNA-binding CsgD family transcriptional regulator
MNARLETVEAFAADRTGVVLDFDRRRKVGPSLGLAPAAPAEQPANEPRVTLAVAALRDLALRVEESPEGPRAWQSFMAGRLTVIDRFEQAGRHVVLAVGDVPAAPRLTRRETEALTHAARGHDDKRIAYELGLQPSTVASLLTRAARKLGVDNRMALIRRFLADARARRSEAPIAGEAQGAPPHGLRSGWLALDGQRVLVLSFPVVAEVTEACAPPLPQLSAAERAVALMLLAGHRRAAIAQLRGAAIGTVNKQVECVYRKLGVGSRRELAARIFAEEARA